MRIKISAIFTVHSGRMALKYPSCFIDVDLFLSAHGILTQEKKLLYSTVHELFCKLLYEAFLIESPEYTDEC